MTGFKTTRRASIWLAAAAMLPVMAAAQSTTAPQTDPALDRFSLPPSTRPSPKPTPESGPVIAPFSRPTPAAPIVIATPTPTPTPSAAVSPTAAPPAVATTAVRQPTAQPTPGGVLPTATATPDAVATPTPAASASPEATVPAPAPTAEPSSDWSAGLLVPVGGGVAALLAIAWLLVARRRRSGEEETIDEIAPEPVAAAPGPVAVPRGHITIPTRRRVGDDTAPKLEITLIPKRAGTNLMSAAVDYRVLVRNVGTVPARDIRFAMYMLSASARQAQELQQIFGTVVEQPMVPPFELEPGAEIDLTGMALLPREQVNVMTIQDRPWFVPVLAMKAEYRWGENVGAPGVATAAHMIGIDRGEGAKMAPFRLDGGPHMHPEVAERKVA